MHVNFQTFIADKLKGFTVTNSMLKYLNGDINQSIATYPVNILNALRYVLLATCFLSFSSLTRFKFCD